MTKIHANDRHYTCGCTQKMGNALLYNQPKHVHEIKSITPIYDNLNQFIKLCSIILPLLKLVSSWKMIMRIVWFAVIYYLNISISLQIQKNCPGGEGQRDIWVCWAGFKAYFQCFYYIKCKFKKFNFSRNGIQTHTHPLDPRMHINLFK